MAAGQATQLLKLVAVSGGGSGGGGDRGAVAGRGPEAARNRLRTVLNRLRAAAGEVIVREGDSLLLAPESGGPHALRGRRRRALALGPAEPALAVATARSAITRYRGDVLPSDLYEQWAELPVNTRAGRCFSCSTSAMTWPPTAATWMRPGGHRTNIDLAPYDDARYLRAAAALLEQGRRGAALAVVRRARAALAELAWSRRVTSSAWRKPSSNSARTRSRTRQPAP